MKPKDDFKRGVETAAGVMDGCGFNATTTHLYRLDDVILCKLNQTRRKKPRRNKLAIQTPEDAWLTGVAYALAEVHRLSGAKSPLSEAAKNAGLTLKEARRVGVQEFDLKDLRKAGVR